MHTPVLTSQLRVGNILTSISPQYGGPPVVARGLGGAMKALGCQITSWATAGAGEIRAAAASDAGANVFPLATPAAWYRAPELALELRQAIHAIDLLHIHEVWSYPQQAAGRVARKSGKPYLITPHGELESRHLRHGGWAKRIKKALYLASIGRALLDGAACVHVLTPQEIEGIRLAGYRGPITVVPNGIDTDAFAELPDPVEAELIWPQLRGRRTVLFLSRLSPEKGLDELLPAWERITRHGCFDDALLVLAGSGSSAYEAAVRRLADATRPAGSVLFTGMVTGRKKMALLSRADLFVLPSHCEGFSMAILEAMAAAKPVLITPGCNFAEVVEADAGRCAVPETDSLESALCSLLDLTPADRAAMGRRGQRLVGEKYTWDMAACKMLTVYHSILQGKHIPLHPAPYFVQQPRRAA